MKKYFILSLFFLFTSATIRSQEIIDLNEAVRIALDNNTNVVNLQRSLQIQQLNTSTARGDLLPNLNLLATWNRNNTYSEGTIRFQNGVPINVPQQNTWINNFSVGMSSDVVLFNGLANYERVNFEEQNERLIRTQLSQERYDVVYTINSAYFDVLKKLKIVAANEVTLADSRAQLESIREFMNVGKRTIADVYRQDVQVAQDELELERSRNDLDKSKVQLLLAMNTNLNTEYEVSEESVNPNLTEVQLREILNRNSNTEALYGLALTKRFDYQAFLQDIRVNQVQLSIDRKNLYFPSISAFGNYNLNAARIQDIQNSRSFSFGRGIL